MKNWVIVLGGLLISSSFLEAKQIGSGEDLNWLTQAERFIEMKDPSIRKVALGALLMGLSCGLIGSYVVTKAIALGAHFPMQFFQVLQLDLYGPGKIIFHY